MFPISIPKTWTYKYYKRKNGILNGLKLKMHKLTGTKIQEKHTGPKLKWA